MRRLCLGCQETGKLDAAKSTFGGKAVLPGSGVATPLFRGLRETRGARFSLPPAVSRHVVSCH